MTSPGLVNIPVGSASLRTAAFLVDVCAEEEGERIVVATMKSVSYRMGKPKWRDTATDQGQPLQRVAFYDADPRQLLRNAEFDAEVLTQQGSPKGVRPIEDIDTYAILIVKVQYDLVLRRSL